MEFTQVPQDNIGDLSNAPEPIQIKLFAQDASLLAELGPRVASEIKKVEGVVDVENGVDNTISGAATSFQVTRNWRPVWDLLPRKLRKTRPPSSTGSRSMTPDCEWTTLYRSRAPWTGDAAGPEHHP